MKHKFRLWTLPKKLLLYGMSFFGIYASYAQDSTNTNFGEPVTLKQCIDYALENHPSMKNSKLDVKISEAQVKETFGLGLPSVTGKVDYLRNIQVQSQFVPANAFEPLAPPDIVTPIGFGVDHYMDANLKVNQLIFDGSYLVGLKASKVYKSLSETSIELTEREVRGNVILAYVMVLLSDKYYQLALENQNSLDSLLRDTKIMYENGFAEMKDVQRLQSSVNRGKVQLIRAQNNVKTSKQLLNYQVGIDLNTDIKLAEDFAQLIEGKTDVSEQTPDVDVERIPEYRMLGIQENLNELDIKNRKTGAVPNIYAFGTLGYNTGSLQFSNLGDNWQDYSMIGVTLSWNLFTGLQRQRRIEQAQYELAKTQNDKEQLERRIKFNVIDSHTKLKNELALMQTSQQNYELAYEVFKATKIEYLEGTASNIEVVDATTEMISTQREYYTNLYNAIVAKIDMENALGHLPSEY